MLRIPPGMNTYHKMAEVCLEPFQKLLEIVSQSQAKIYLMICFETQVSNSNSNF